MRPAFPDQFVIHRSPRRPKKPPRETLRVFNRMVSLLSKYIGYDSVRQFITGGQPLLIHGERATFRLFYHGGLTKVRIKTEVLVAGQRICDLCIFALDTSPLDHAVSMIVHVRAGLEDELLTIGNPSHIALDAPTGIEVLDTRCLLLGPMRQNRTSEKI
jgi:hypothetical protein